MQEKISYAIDKAEQWIINHKDQFRFVIDNLKGALNIEDIKQFGELTLVLNFCKKNDNSKLNQMISTSELWTDIEQGEYFFRLLLTRPDLIVLSGIIADFKDLGYINNKLISLLRLLEIEMDLKLLEKQNWQIMDIYQSLNRLNITDEPIDLKKSVLASFMPPWHINNATAYAITHEIFYITKFGTREPKIEDCIYNYIKGYIGSWMEIFYFEKNLDILLELVMSACFLNIPFDLFYLDFILENQFEDGSFPGVVSENKQIENSDTLNNELFKNNYHTTLVGILALHTYNIKTYSK